MEMGSRIFGCLVPQKWSFLVKLMSDEIITERFYGGEVKSGVWIVLINANHVPPHVIMICDNKTYSLEYNGVFIKSVDSLLRFVKTRTIETVMFQVETSPEEVEPAFLKYKHLNNDVTCLAPVKDFCASNLNPQAQKCDFIFELIPLLKELGHIQRIG